MAHPAGDDAPPAAEADTGTAGTDAAPAEFRADSARARAGTAGRQAAGSGTRRPTLTERRKAETRWAIASTACTLFAERGAAGTTAEEIAAASGVGLRTFYRYFRSKEDAVEPVLADGARRWLDLVAAGPPGLPSPAALADVAAAALAPDDPAGTEAMLRTGALLRGADPALEGVWARVNLRAERDLAAHLARLAPASSPLTIRTTAAAAATAIRVAIEAWAASPDLPTTGPASPAATVRTTMQNLAGRD